MKKKKCKKAKRKGYYTNILPRLEITKVQIRLIAKELDAEFMVILDSDGQHDPSYIPDFIKALKTNKADVVSNFRKV